MTRERAAPPWQRRRSCPASGGDQHAALHELGDEAEHVAFYGAVLGALELGLDRGHHARKAAPPVELVPDGLACVVQGEELVLPVTAGDQGPPMISPPISRATTSPAGFYTSSRAMLTWVPLSLSSP